MSYAEVLRAARGLSPEEQAQLVDELCVSNESPLGDEWSAEIARRNAEIDAGTAELLTWEEAQRRHRAGKMSGDA
jgi:putative addiction module component (TIGR02574 family)